MSFSQLYDFIDLLNRNNSKEWMDRHRSEYHAVRDFFIKWLDTMNERLAVLDDTYFNTPGRKAINRINNNLLYHPERPVYKDHFGAGLDQLSKQGDFYIELGAHRSFIGGGYWHPDSTTLKSIRQAIDYNGDQLKEILATPDFTNTFGSMVDDQPLKRPPKGFTADHPHIDLLKRRSYAAICELSREEVCTDGFQDRVEEIYIKLLPFRRYLNQAVSV